MAELPTFFLVFKDIGLRETVGLCLNIIVLHRDMKF